MTNEEKLEIEKIIRETLPDALERERIRRMERPVKEAKPDPEPERETKTYLVSFAGHQIAFPAEHGNAVMHQSLYTRVSRVKQRWSEQWSVTDALVIAYADGRPLAKPVRIVMVNYISAMVEVDEAVIFKDKTTATAA